MTVIHGDCLEVMPALDQTSVDAIVTDPPYGLKFMGRQWDHGVPGVLFWKEALRVAKPGAHLVAFGGTRTYHRLTVAIEDAGWVIRDCLSWLYGSGFPKSHNGAWGGTALKPAWEPIVLARKPLVGTVEANVEQFGTGGLNIDECRIEHADEADRQSAFPGGRCTSKPGALAGGTQRDGERSEFNRYAERGGTDFAALPGPRGGDERGRWPANVVLDEEAARLLDEQSGDVKGAVSNGRRGVQGVYHDGVGAAPQLPSYADTGGASRFFYTAKASRAERNAGLEHRDEKPLNWSSGTQNPGAFQSPNTHRAAKNHHPTVKPLDLMQWLCRLITPKGGLILDPFCGSGTTGRAAVAEGFRFVGIEKEAEYVEIAKARIAEYAPLFKEAENG